MNKLTTNEAAKLAADMRTQSPNLTMKQIGKKLAEAGYMSWRTGKPVSAGGVSVMILKFIAGETIVDRNPRKHAKLIASKQERRGKPRPERKVESVHEVYTHAGTPISDEPKVKRDDQWVALDEANARLVMQKAMEKILKSLFGVNCRVLLPNDVTFRVNA